MSEVSHPPGWLGGMKPVDVALGRRAAARHGVVHRRQALALGMTATVAAQMADAA